MPSKKKKYNARFPAGRIKKIMQTDEEVGKVAQAVPVIISRTLELFVESLLRTTMQITSAKNAKTLTPTHMKQCIRSENRFDFLRDLVKNVPDVSSTEDEPLTPSSPAVAAPGGAPGGAHTSYAGFQFSRQQQKGAAGASLLRRSSAVASHARAEPRTPGTPSAPHTPVTPSTPTSSSVFPKFYNELPIGSDEDDDEIAAVQVRAPVIQHTASVTSIPQTHHKPLPAVPAIASQLDTSSSEEDDEDDETPAPAPLGVPHNGFHPAAVVPSFRAQTVEIDEDYDT